MITDHMTTLSISIEGLLLHVSRGLARRAAQNKPLLKLMAKLLLMFMVILRGAADKPNRSLGQRLRRCKVLPGQKARRFAPSTSQSRRDGGAVRYFATARTYSFMVELGHLTSKDKSEWQLSKVAQ